MSNIGAIREGIEKAPPLVLSVAASQVF